MVPTKGGGRHECDQQHRHHNHVPQKFLQIKQEDKFFSRLQSKESTSKESSFRVLYYGGAATGATIPFTWESTPGTPKHPLSDTSFIPPLTPPPSYNQMKSPASSGLINSHNKPSLSGKFLQFLSMPRRSSNKEKQKSPSTSSSSFSYSSSFSSSSHSIPSTKNSSTGSRGTNKSRSSESDPVAAGHFWRGDEEEEEEVENVNKVDQQITISSPTSTLCFGRGKIGMKKMKSTVLSFVGHATPQKFR